MEEREAEAVSETKTKAKGRTKEQIYREQMQALGIYEEIFEPEIKTLARVEREYTRAEKAWSATAAPGGKPSFLDPHYAIIQRLRAEILQHREALGLTPKALRKLTGAAGVEAPEQKDLITAKLDRIAERVSGYDLTTGSDIGSAGVWIQGEDGMEKVGSVDPKLLADPFAEIPAAVEAAAISDKLDQQDAAKISHGMDEDLAAAVAEDMG